MENGKSQNTFSSDPDLRPKRFEFMEKLGEGGFGMVLKCLDTNTRDTVAVKLPKCKVVPLQEVTILRKCMDKNFDDCNIVKFHDCCDITLGPALVFEDLDIDLHDYLAYSGTGPMTLNDVRIITKQLATALNALKSVGVIHADIKPDNIMLVSLTRPFEVKLIDFGSAINRSKARQGMTLQIISFRAPEIFLGLPFSEAIDMWALGQVVVNMLFNFPLIDASFEYEAMKLIVDVLGVPPDHLLNQGIRTHYFFMKTESNTWRLMTPEEYLREASDVTFNTRSSLDDLKRFYWKTKDDANALQTHQCFELLKAMMTMDESQRITPLGVLSHPFITQDHYQDDQDEQDYEDYQDDQDEQDQQDEQDYQDDQDEQDQQDEQDYQDDQDEQDQQDDQDYQDQKLTTDEGTVPPPTAPPSREIQVRPAAAENTLQPEDEERADSLQDGPNETSEVSCDTSPPQSPAMTSGQDSEDEQKKKKKKKKNICQRIWSWMKKTFRSNRVGVVGNEEGKK